MKSVSEALQERGRTDAGVDKVRVVHLLPLLPKFRLEVLLRKQELEPHEHLLRVVRPQQRLELLDSKVGEPDDGQVGKDCVKGGVGAERRPPSVMVEGRFEGRDKGGVAQCAVDGLAEECGVGGAAGRRRGEGGVEVAVDRLPR